MLLGQEEIQISEKSKGIKLVFRGWQSQILMLDSADSPQVQKPKHPKLIPPFFFFFFPYHWLNSGSTWKALKYIDACVPNVAQWVKNMTNIHEDDFGLIPGLSQWVKDLALLWLWHRPVATALI